MTDRPPPAPPPSPSPAWGDGAAPQQSTGWGLEALWQLLEPPGGRPSADPLLGADLGGVTLTRFVAEGGMGRVYAGMQTAPRREVAVKLIRPGLLSRDAVSRFLREVEILGALRHPWISQIYSAGALEVSGMQLPYFVMEYIPDALPLTDYASQKDLSLVQRLELFRSICDAIAYAHAQRVVHLDLKPANLLVDALGHSKVIDFGIASRLSVQAEAQSEHVYEQLPGTLQYMSPEQCRGDAAAIDHRSDVYALGVILYELVAGKLPYDLDGKTVPESLRIVEQFLPPPPTRAGEETPALIADLALRCLAKDRDQRVGSVREVATMLASACEALRAATSRRTAPRRQRDATGKARPRRWTVSPRLTLVVAACGLLLAYRARESGEPRDKRPPEPGRPARAGTGGINSSAGRFMYGFRSVLQSHADRHLVEHGGMVRWFESWARPPVSYWGPSHNGGEGRLVYRFDFGGKATRIRLRAQCRCWDFTGRQDGRGRGAAALDVSGDGTAWLTLRSSLDPRNWGQGWNYDEELPRVLVGIETLWVRIRCATEGVPHPGGYTVAQFARSPEGEEKNVFQVEAELE